MTLKKIDTKELEDKMEALGYENLLEFHAKSGIPFSYETIRGFFKSGKVKSPEFYLLLLKHLEYPIPEIKKRLEGIGDKVFSVLLAGSHRVLSPYQEAILMATDKIRKVDPKGELMVSFFRVLAKTYKIDLSKELKLLERKPPKEADD